MNKKELKSRLDETIKAIKNNSVDASLADRLILDLLILKSQIEREPAMLCLYEKDVESRYDGDTFSLISMKDDTVVYHVTGGMDIVCKPNLYSLNTAIRSFINDSKRIERMSEEEKMYFNAELEASAYVLNVPMIAFSDSDFLFDTAKSVISFLKRTFDKQMNVNLQRETFEEDSAFKNAMVALDGVLKKGEGGESKD